MDAPVAALGAPAEPLGPSGAPDFRERPVHPIIPEPAAADGSAAYGSTCWPKSVSYVNYRQENPADRLLDLPLLRPRRSAQARHGDPPLTSGARNLRQNTHAGIRRTARE